MTREEALRVLNADNEADAIDFFEEKIFEFRQLLLIKVPFRKLLDSKIERLRKNADAYALLQTIDSGSAVELNVEIGGDTIREVFNHFNVKRNELKLLVAQSEKADELIAFAYKYLDLYSQYAEKWKNEAFDSGEIKASVEFDPMDIHNAIQEAEEIGVIEFSDILKLPEESLLQKEMKRLNLWLKFNADGRSV